MGTGWFFSRRDEGEIDIFWLRHESLEESDNLPDVLAQEIVVPRLASLGTTPSQDPRPARGPRRGVDDLEAALEQFREIVADLYSELIALKRRSVQSRDKKGNGIAGPTT